MAASDAKEVSHTCSWAGTHRPAATRGRSQTPRGTAHTGGAHTKGQTRHPHGEGTCAPAQARPRQTPREAPHPEARHGPGSQHPLGGHIRPHRSPAVPEPALCRPPASVCTVCACVSMCVKRPPPRPEPCSHRAVTPPPPHQAPALSPGRRPPTTARPSYLERWGDGCRYQRDTPLPSAPTAAGKARRGVGSARTTTSTPRPGAAPPPSRPGEAQGSAGQGASSQKES